MDDQHRWDALGFVNPAVRTPHLDALAKSGVFFDQAASQPPWRETARSTLSASTTAATPTYWSKASDEQWRLMTLRYRPNCTWIDDMFGRTLQKPREKGHGGQRDHRVLLGSR
jgi:arylsulfatase A-like enzyme